MALKIGPTKTEIRLLKLEADFQNLAKKLEQSNVSDKVRNINRFMLKVLRLLILSLR